MSSFDWPPNGGSGGVPIYDTLADFPPGSTAGDLAVAADTGDLYEWNGSAWQQIGGPGSALTLGNLDSQSPTAKGAALTSGVLSMQSASGAATGVLKSADWTTFNNKQNALSFGNLTDVGTDGIVVTGGTGSVIGSGTSIAQHVADSTHNGYLSSADWSTFNGKQAAGNYITALTGDGSASGPGSAAFTLATVNSNTGSFGSSTAIPSFTVNGKGLITAASTNAVIAPAGTLTGTTLASNVVTSSLTTVGTIGSGTWQGTIIAKAYGGTNQDNSSLTFPSSGTIPAYTPTNHGVVISGAGAAANVTSAGTSGQVLTSNGASADPTFQTLVSLTPPTLTVLTSGSGTYTTPANVTYLKVKVVGGGGGGGDNGGTPGSNGGNTTFNSTTLVGNGGTGGASSGGAGGSGGTASISGISGVAHTGATGQGGSAVSNGQCAGGQGGSTSLGGAGAGGRGGAASNGVAAIANTGSGGGGASGSSGQSIGAGGGAGGEAWGIIASPSATYSYAVGASGAGATGGSVNGGAGGSGIIIVEEHYGG